MNRRYLSIGCVFVLVLLGLVSCSIPLGEPGNRGSGSIGLSVPSMALWVEEGQVASPNARALAYATSVRVEILDSAKKRVVPLYEKVLAVAAQEKLDVQVPDIPAGNNYTINVEVFNSNVPGDNPVVRGSKKGVSVQAGKAVGVTVVCLPVEPARIEPPTRYVLNSGGEKWFSLDCAADKFYNFTVLPATDASLALFSASGILLAKHSAGRIDYYSSTGGKVYVGLSRSLALTGSIDYEVKVEQFVGLKPTMIEVPAGTFQRDPTSAANKSFVSSFKISSTEITRAQYLAV